MKLNAWHIREFQFPQDYEAVIDLWSHAGDGVHLGPSDTLDEIKKKLDYAPDLFLVAEKDGEIIGAVMGGFDGRRGLVYHLAVKQDYRRQGIASALMDELEKRFKQRGCLRAYLLVTRDNIEARDYYEKRGWVLMDILTYGKNFN
ncbi:MAG: GNAT family N-acetyltransferase [Anaerolineales bacterium]